MPHVLELFGGGCPLCDTFRKEVESGKCGPCELRVIDVRDPAAGPQIEQYDVRAVPTLVIDGHIKVVGSLDEPWVCDDAFYGRLEERFPMPNAGLQRTKVSSAALSPLKGPLP